MADDIQQKLALDFVAGLIDGDLYRVRAALTPDATWSVPGETVISGVASGADAVVERVRTIHSSPDVDIRLERVLHGLHNVAVVLHNTGRRGGAHLNEQVVIAFTLADGRIAAADNLISDVAGLNHFFAQQT